ncbi:hypothetical protein JG688_00012392 [Phytophthora aleatoria]|uniref:Uncharacterized protein n=1 Tax=Phytophthora aleatoria TaxID=2496075 RepID=A0A8J5LZY1_9STRA|nr:hypothetical protein JG688_00012392 [Phytophthora aleatoria]
MRGHTVTLVIYEYGMSIARAQERDEFIEACIRPEQTDRAGATAEISLRDVVERLQAQWGATFRGDTIVWRMWYIANLLRANDSRLEQHLAGVTQSANVALDVVLGSIADYQQLRQEWEVFGHRLQLRDRSSTSRNVEDTEHAE